MMLPVQHASEARWRGLCAALGLSTLAFDALPPLPGVYCPLPEYLAFFLLPLSLFRLYRLRGKESLRDMALPTLFALYIVGNSAARLLGNQAARQAIFPGFRPTAIEILLGYSLYLFIRSIPGGARRLVPSLDGIASLMARWYPLLFVYAGIESLTLVSGPLYRLFLPLKLATNGFTLQGLQGFSIEPSWFALQISFFLPFLFYARSRGSIDRKKFILRILLVLAVSLLSRSILCVLYTSLFFVYRLVVRHGAKGLALAALAIVLGIATLGLVLRFSDSQDMKLRRFESLYRLDFAGFTRYSSSEMVRLYYPIMGLREFALHPLFGVGGHESPRYMVAMIREDYPWMFERNDEIPTGVERTPEHLGPRSFLPRIAGENGIVGLLILSAMAFSWFRGARMLRDPIHRRFCRDILVVMFLCGLQFESYDLFSFWAGMALLGLLQREAGGRR